jgi:two-component system chemotaxis response regulator CheB
MYAERLNANCLMQVQEAADGDVVRQGQVFVAPGDKHMRVVLDHGVYRLRCHEGEKVSGHCPSVDVLFTSVAEAAGDRALGLLLTGMGADGAQGLLRMRNAGARTIAQDEATCVVFGMPREAIRLGAADRVLPLDRIASAILA